jgi:ArsR family transcriptional regulator, arsenate/arsenite/antimonite-responsive transcriptional repressor
MALKVLPVVRERGVCCGLPDVDERWAEQTSTLMKALADPTRLTMMASLWKAKTPICICDFTAGLDLSQPTISFHMGKLREAGLVESEKRGIWTYYRLASTLEPATRQLLSRLIS